MIDIFETHTENIKHIEEKISKVLKTKKKNSRLPVIYPLFWAKDDAGHVKDDSQGHFSNLTQLLLFVGHADSYSINQNKWIHSLGAILLTVEHGSAWLATQLVGRQQERTLDWEQR